MVVVGGGGALSAIFIVNGKRFICQLYYLHFIPWWLWVEALLREQLHIRRDARALLPGSIRSKVDPVKWAKRFCPLMFRRAQQNRQTSRRPRVLHSILKFKNLNCHVFLKFPSRGAIVSSTFSLWETDLGLAGGAGNYFEMFVLKMKQGESLCCVVCSGLDEDVSIMRDQDSRFMEEMRLVRAKAFFIPCHHLCSFEGRTLMSENVSICYKKQEPEQRQQLSHINERIALSWSPFSKPTHISIIVIWTGETCEGLGIC